MFCTYCGAKNDASNKFCENCGQQLGGTPSSTQTGPYVPEQPSQQPGPYQPYQPYQPVQQQGQQGGSMSGSYDAVPGSQPMYQPQIRRGMSPAVKVLLIVFFVVLPSILIAIFFGVFWWWWW